MKTPSWSTRAGITKTRLLLIVATLVFVVVLTLLLADQQFALSLMLIVVLGAFGWYRTWVSRPLKGKIAESNERRDATRKSSDEASPEHSHTAINDPPDKTILRPKTDHWSQAEPVLSETIINCLPGIFYFYDRDGHFIRWNKNFEIVSGYTSEEVSTMHPLNFFHDDDRQLLNDRIEEVFAKGYSDVTADFFTKDKRRIPFYFNGRRVNFEGKDYLIGMGLDIRDRVRAENALIERNKTIEKLSEHLQNVREEERARIALEIHDVLGQQLTALRMDSNWLRKRSPDEASSQRIISMIALIDDTIRTVRKISSDLRPAILDDLGLIAALEWQGSEFEKNTGIDLQFESNATDVTLERRFATNIFRVFQEALTNISRHAKATKVHASFVHRGDFVELVVKDNGIGINLDETSKKQSLGLISMKERARNFNGTVNIGSSVPHGTIVNMKVPLPASTHKS